jgi:hypothetical protein
MNAFVWYLFVFGVIGSAVSQMGLAPDERFAIWSLNFVSTAVAVLFGAVITSRAKKRDLFLFCWMLFGVASSIIPVFFQALDKGSLFFIVFLFGVAFGLGMPSSMGYFSDSTTIQSRATLGGMAFLIMGLGSFLLGIFQVTQVTQALAIAAVWRASGTAAFVLIKPSESTQREDRRISYKAILSQRSFMLYFTPWAMFCLINQTSIPVIYRSFGEEFTTLLTAIEFALIGVTALISGIICDKIGRRRVAIFGFVMLGIGYAILGIFPQVLISRYFYILADGVAWGIFNAVFFMTIWGDLAGDTSSEKYYAIGGLPYLMSNFLRYALGSLIADTVSLNAIFSLASFFLFLAVLPLMYASETLPEKEIRERELKKYVEKAKKVKEKYA